MNMLSSTNKFSLARTPLQEANEGEFWFLWVFVATLGLIAGLVIGAEILDILWPGPPALPNVIIDYMVTHIFLRLMIVGALVGFLMGGCEWLVVRHYLPKSGGWWLLTSISIWAIFPPVAEAISSWIHTREVGIQPLLTGITIGIAQWYFLRRIIPKAGWWILARTVSSFLIFFSITPSPLIESSVVILGLVASAITGIAITLLLRQPSPDSDPIIYSHP